MGDNRLLKTWATEGRKSVHIYQACSTFSSILGRYHLNQIIAKYRKLAHLPKSTTKVGMHSLRHTLASLLLESNTPLPIISDILGHADTESTSVYLKVDITKLKECPLDFMEDTEYA